MATASSESNDASDQVIELIVRDASAPSSDAEADADDKDQIAPLLSNPERPKINIFTASYPRRKPRDEVTRLLESETSPFTQVILWVWNGSRYSGLLCMALSSTIYFLMGVLTNIFSVQAIPLFETAFTRCTIILILSYLWLRRSEQPLFGTSHVRIILLLRALTGCISMSIFVYCFQRLPFSQAIVLNSAIPIMASIMARVFLHEKLKVADIASLACSFFGVLFFFREMLATEGQLVKAKQASNTYAKTGHHIFAILLGLFSSIMGGTSYCLIRAGAKASDQPLLTVFSFGLFASPAMGICTYIFEDFVLPGFQSILIMLVLSILAFFAEVLLARGLQLERTGKVANIQYLEAALRQFWSLALTRVAPSFDHLVGVLLIVISVCCTMYIGPDKEME
ncbi:membrane protein [Spatholobus suberectus]|nr:membrane protein [Spatholobus suberectus]